LKVFFDNCTSPVMAQTLAGYLSATTTVHHARDLGLHAKTDVEWISYLQETKDEWLVVTGDGRIQKNRAEREAFRRAGLRGVVLNPAYQKTPMGRCCGMIVAKWDDLISFTDRIEPPFLVEMSINLTSRFKLLPL
jgi:hypothetical protein